MKALITISLLSLLPLHAAEKKQEAEPRVTVGGQVRSPGPISYRKDLTLYTAIQSARGANEFGAIKRVKLMRDGKTEIYDATDDKQMQTPLKPNDVVIVPQKNILGK